MGDDTNYGAVYRSNRQIYHNHAQRLHKISNFEVGILRRIDKRYGKIRHDPHLPRTCEHYGDALEERQRYYDDDVDNVGGELKISDVNKRRGK